MQVTNRSEFTPQTAVARATPATNTDDSDAKVPPSPPPAAPPATNAAATADISAKARAALRAAGASAGDIAKVNLKDSGAVAAAVKHAKAARLGGPSQKAVAAYAAVAGKPSA